MAKVLIVEDHELNLKLFSDILELNGFEVLQARDGVSGFEMARQHRPDLILMDIQLPGVSGLEVTKMIKADRKLGETPVVAITAFAMKGDEERFRAAGCAAYIAKPISIERFLAMIRKHIVVAVVAFMLLVCCLAGF